MSVMIIFVGNNHFLERECWNGKERRKQPSQEEKGTYKRNLGKRTVASVLFCTAVSSDTLFDTVQSINN
jgi:hypothetical protein